MRQTSHPGAVPRLPRGNTRPTCLLNVSPFTVVQTTPSELKWFSGSALTISGFFSAYSGPVVHQDTDYVVHLGDYIYESGSGGKAIGREPSKGKELATLDDYRKRYAQYRSDVSGANVPLDSAAMPRADHSRTCRSTCPLCTLNSPSSPYGTTTRQQTTISKLVLPDPTIRWPQEDVPIRAIPPVLPIEKHTQKGRITSGYRSERWI